MTVFFINPFSFEAGADFESIATVTVGSGGASSIEFTSIPGTYQHLQIRLLGRGTIAATGIDFIVRVNGVSTSSYAYHQLRGNGTSASANGYASQAEMNIDAFPGANSTGSIFGAAIIDVLDYASTSKTTTVRTFGGNDQNGSGRVSVTSGLYNSTNAVTSVAIIPGVNNLAQYSTAALYGIKAP